MVDEVTGRGFKATVLMGKDNKFCSDKMRVEMTDGKRFFFSSSMPCVSSIRTLLLSKGWPKKVKRFNCGSERKSLALSLSQASFITINCVVTPADIQIDLPSSGDHSACAEVSHTKDSFVSLMKGFLPQRSFKPKSTYFILRFDCCNGLIYEVTVETRWWF